MFVSVDVELTSVRDLYFDEDDQLGLDDDRKLLVIILQSR